MRCECGETMTAWRAPEYDFSSYAGPGLTVMLESVPVLRCQGCGSLALEGELVDKILSHLAQAMTVAPLRLNFAELRFLRKHLGLTQHALAARLGISRVTVADWERGAEPISPTHETKLRSMVALEGLGLRDRLKTLRAASASGKGLPADLDTLTQVQHLLERVVEPEAPTAQSRGQFAFKADEILRAS